MISDDTFVCISMSFLETVMGLELVQPFLDTHK